MPRRRRRESTSAESERGPSRGNSAVRFGFGNVQTPSLNVVENPWTGERHSNTPGIIRGVNRPIVIEDVISNVLEAGVSLYGYSTLTADGNLTRVRDFWRDLYPRMVDRAYKLNQPLPDTADMTNADDEVEWFGNWICAALIVRTIGSILLLPGVNGTIRALQRAALPYRSRAQSVHTEVESFHVPALFRQLVDSRLPKLASTEGQVFMTQVFDGTTVQDLTTDAGMSAFVSLAETIVARLYNGNTISGVDARKMVHALNVMYPAPGSWPLPSPVVDQMAVVDFAMNRAVAADLTTDIHFPDVQGDDLPVEYYYHDSPDPFAFTAYVPTYGFDTETGGAARISWGLWHSFDPATPFESLVYTYDEDQDHDAHNLNAAISNSVIDTSIWVNNRFARQAWGESATQTTETWLDQAYKSFDIYHTTKLNSTVHMLEKAFLFSS